MEMMWIGRSKPPNEYTGGNLDVDLRWDGRSSDEEAYRRRCLIFAIGIVKRQHKIKLKQ